MKRFFLFPVVASLVVVTAFGIRQNVARAAESVYGALFEVGHLQAETGSNAEVVLMYYPPEDGFVALTTNDDGVEWWTSDKLGLQWEILEDNPFADYNCMQSGRHAVKVFNETTYFGMMCEGGAYIFKLTSLTSAELVHLKADEESEEDGLEEDESEVESLATKKEEPQDEEPEEDEQKGGAQPDDQNGCPDEDGDSDEEAAVKSLAAAKKESEDAEEDEEQLDDESECPDEDGESGGQPEGGANMKSGYPTAAVLEDELFMFYDGGYTVCDLDEFCTDVTDAENQPSGVPLEASSEYNSNVYLPFTTGEVMAFDGISYTQIGENYFDSDATNLPAAEVHNGILYVGTDANGNGNGAALYSYDLDADDPEWELVSQLGEKNNIINKMQTSEEIDGSSYLVYYTANTEEGTNIWAVDEDGVEISLIDAGLGGENPENNTEVVSVVNRIVDDGGEEKVIMLFGTQNKDDEGKIFVLQLGSDLAVTPTQEEIVVDADFSLEIARKVQAKGKNKNKEKAKVKNGKKETAGSIFEVLLQKEDLEVGDVYTLYVNGKRVDKVKVKSTKKDLTLEYRRSKSLQKGQKLTVQVGRKLAYGSGKKTVLARNVVVGDALKITVTSTK